MWRCRDTFKALKKSGHPFETATAAKYKPLAAAALDQVLTNIDYSSKANEILQLSDLVLYPVAYSKEHIRQQRAYAELRRAGKLVDTHYRGDDAAEFGIKYFCFDGLETEPPPEGGGRAAA